ncbi:hypothetical protein JI739_17305 [Ramlibacter sp. AW1]|uniref:DUF4124 domain-containing protein n=1 Tax=Ramlibacter aurantiacus TaxID=2801330 RepID=A0A936ZIN0_9BURK|nr:hypothetical protein [Ramlibacter aurantiacus]MBL0422109.1 hypothetical protein [Ramlibacter aurantiacus]
MNARRGVTIVLLASLPAWSQPIYRCGDTYGPQPCEGGRQVEAADPRTAGQQAQTETAARRDARLAEGLQRERLQKEARLEAEQRRMGTTGSKGTAPIASSWDELDFDLKPRGKQPIFVARVPGKPTQAAAKPRTAATAKQTERKR